MFGAHLLWNSTGLILLFSFLIETETAIDEAWRS